MSNPNFLRYKRIVQYFWDPEPKNHAGFNTPIWCLGKKYGCGGPAVVSTDVQRPSVEPGVNILDSDALLKPQNKLETSETTSDDGEKWVHTKNIKDLQWPSGFLEDFESRIWFTYRANFPPIEESSDFKSTNTTSLPLRIRGHLVNAGVFTSDTGWGCMIRSGQSLLANALVMLKLGRGTNSSSPLWWILCLIHH